MRLVGHMCIFVRPFQQLPEAPAPVKEPPHVLKEESRDEAAEENVQVRVCWAAVRRVSRAS